MTTPYPFEPADQGTGLEGAAARAGDDLELVRRLSAEARDADAQADELTRDALRRHHTDAVAHMRATLAVRVTEQHSASGRLIANLRRDGYERAAEDVRSGLTIAAAVALHLVDQPLPGDRRPPARELAAGVVGGCLAEAGAPSPVELAGELLRQLERAGLALTHRPTR